MPKTSRIGYVISLCERAACPPRRVLGRGRSLPPKPGFDTQVRVGGKEDLSNGINQQHATRTSAVGRSPTRSAWPAGTVHVRWYAGARATCHSLLPRQHPNLCAAGQKFADERQVAVLSCRCERALLLQVETELTLQSLRRCRRWRDRWRNHPLPYQQIQ